MDENPIMSAIRKFACAVGIHRRATMTKWVPSIYAPIVTEHEFKIFCVHCKKTLFHAHSQWNGTEMVDIKKAIQS